MLIVVPGYRIESCRILPKSIYTNATRATPAATAANKDEMGPAPMDDRDVAAFASAAPVAPEVGVLAGTICFGVRDEGMQLIRYLTLFCICLHCHTSQLTCKLLGSGKSGDVAAVGVPFAARLEYRLLNGVP